MINYDSILSAFDGKPTLLQWLKLVKKALDESVLKDITLNQDGANVVFTFNFEDGTSISTPAVTLPKGDTGAKGDKGEQGVSVTGVDEVSNEVVGGQTLTTLRFNFSNGTNNEVVVHAENGKDASGGKLYRHEITLNRNYLEYIYFYFYCSTENHIANNKLGDYVSGSFARYNDESGDGYAGYVLITNTVSFYGTIVYPLNEPSSWKLGKIENVPLSEFVVDYNVIEM